MSLTPAFDIPYQAGRFPPAYDYASALPPVSVIRNFTLTSKAAGQYFEPQAPMSRGGTTSISLKFYISPTETNSQLLQWGKLLVRIVDQTTITIWLDTSFDSQTFTVPMLGGYLNEFMIEFTQGSGSFTMMLNGISYPGNTVKSYDAFQGYRYFFARWLGVYFNGIISDIKVSYDSVDTHFWSLDIAPGDSVEVDSISALDLAIINLTAPSTTEYEKTGVTWSNGSVQFDEAF